MKSCEDANMNNTAIVNSIKMSPQFHGFKIPGKMKASYGCYQASICEEFPQFVKQT